jgi:hypothetical protein
MTYTTIKHKNKTVELNFTNPVELREWAQWQLGKAHYPSSMSAEEFRLAFNQRIQFNWDRINTHVDMTSVKKVIDVGSGVSMPDLITSALNPDTEFYLVDKSENTRATNGRYYQQVHGHYNSWNVVEDCINSSNLDRNKFNFLDPNDVWPEQVDLILSTYSWCWHYPKETYWDRVKNSLKIGGTLALDIFNLPDRDTAQEISEELGSEPIVIKAKSVLHLSPFKDQVVMKDGAPGGFYVWTRNK